MPFFRSHVLVCAGGACVSSGCKDVKSVLIEKLKEYKLDKEIKVVETGCVGCCELGPIMTIYPEGIFYQKIKPSDVEEIVVEHFLKGRVVKRLLYTPPKYKEAVLTIKEIPFFKRQQKNVLRNCGLINPQVIEEYIARDGYQALVKVLTEMTPEEVIAEIEASGLRGRGGGGFPTGLKWKFTRASKGNEKFVVCNGDEGDPGAFMDRSLLEGDPHAVIEGMIIAGYAVGSKQGYVYVRAEYPLAIERLSWAINQAREKGLLGENILNTDFTFDIEIRRGSGAFVCGEETALMISIEGKRGQPRPRPPFPAQKGLWDAPTLLNNVETYANVPLIILKGAKWYSQIGTKGSKGTKIFALAGDINNTGLVEVPMGTSLGDIIFDIGGGIPKGKKFKAAQSGGPSGGCIPAQHLNVPIDYDSLQELGAIMGSGGLIVMDEDTCMVDMARFFMDFVQDESCGKCPPCREGTKKMLEILTRITQGKGKEGDIELLEELAYTIKDSALCGLGQTAPNPVLSTIRYFRDEYEAHIKEKRCPAVVCSALFRAPCQHTCPLGQDVPGYVALIADGRFEEALALIRQTNPFPGILGRICSHKCESKCRRGTLDEPISICRLKRFAADIEREKGKQIITPIGPKREEKVAIIGAGPSGLACAHELSKRGYNVVVFDSLPFAGGMLRVGIPEYRLPSEVIDYEVGIIERMGVEIRLNTTIGKDISFNSLRNDFDAIYIATGAHINQRLNIPGEDMKGVLSGIDFLRDISFGKKVDIGEKVLVIGGGNAAIDAARSALRLGAKNVTMVYRRREEDMPAYEEEIKEALKEGVKINTLLGPKEIKGNGKVTHLVCNIMALREFDIQGRRKPYPTDQEIIMDADSIIVAIGQIADLSFLDGVSPMLKKGKTIKVDKYSMMTDIEGIFAGGDVTTGPLDAVNAVAAGIKAADNIDKYLRNKKGEGPWEEEKIKFNIPIIIEEELKEKPRILMPENPPAERIADFREVELGYTEKMAMEEAKRCLRCDLELED